MKHLYGHFLLFVARICGATREELDPRYARLPCRQGRP